MGKYNIGSNFDESFINAMNFQMQLNQRRDEANQDIQFQMRQLSLLDEFRNAQLKQDQAQFESGIKYKEEALKQEQSQFEDTQKYKYDVLGQDQTQFESKLKSDQLRTEKELGLGYAKLAEDKEQFGLLLPIKEAEISAKLQSSSKQNEKDIAKLVGDINYGVEEGNDSNVIADTEQLMELTGLKNDTNILWQDIQEGYSFEESIKSLNDYKKSKGLPEYTKDQVNYLKLYFRARAK